MKWSPFYRNSEMVNMVLVLYIIYLVYKTTPCMGETVPNTYSSTILSSGVSSKAEVIPELPVDYPPDDAVLRNIGLDFFMPQSNCIELFGFNGVLYYVREGLPMRQALQTKIVIPHDVTQLTFRFLAKSPLLYEAGLSILNDTRKVLQYDLIDADTDNTIHHHAPANTMTDVQLNISCGTLFKPSDSLYGYTVAFQLNFTFALHGRNVDDTRSIIINRVKQCFDSRGKAVTVDVERNVKMSSVKIFFISVFITLLLVILTTILFSVHHYRSIKTSVQAHKANHITRQQQRAAALMSISAYTDSSYSSTNQRNPAVQSSVSMHGGGGARNTPTSCFQELAHLKPARSECFSGSPGGCSNLLKHGLHSTSHNMVLFNPNCGLSDMMMSSPATAATLQPPPYALSQPQLTGGGVGGTTSPTNSGFMAPVHTAANSIGGSGTSATPSDHVSGSRSSEPTVAGAILDNQISRSQIQFNEIVLQGTFGMLHHATIQFNACDRNSIRSAMIKTVNEHASQDHIETMLRECNVFSTINPHDCQHVLPLIAIVMGAGGATGVTNGERHRVGGGGSGSGEDGEDEDEDDNYLSVHMPPLVIYPQTTFGILKLHLRHLRHTRQSLTTRDIVGMGVQILQGLQFIVKRKLEFNDLATRNCHLDEGWIIRIGDAALARDLFPEDYQCLGDNVNRPIKWLALEAISKYIYSPANDVWSFGITLWELWTLAEQPYEEIDPFEMVSFLKEGGRLYQPQNCPDALYRCMCSCWAHDPAERPNVSKLIKYLEEFYRTLGAFL